MPIPSPVRTHKRFAAATLLGLFTAHNAQALLRFDDSRNQVYVTAYAGVGWDSNIYANPNGDNADLLVSGGAGMEYSRKAGLIGVNASLGWDLGTFSNFSGEDFLNPSASVEFSKGTGRTTGSVQINAQRSTRADPTVGLRTDSWNYNFNLNLRYPVIERYSLAGNFGWDLTDYSDETGTFSDLNSYTLGTDLFYSWRSDRDLLGGYRYRLSESSANSESTDHSFYAGVSGRIVSKLSGSLRAGWNFRTATYPAGIPEESNDGLYVSMAATWPASRKATFTLAATEDFSTTSSNFQTKSTTVDLTGKFSHNVKFSTNANVGVGLTDYLSGFVNNGSLYTPKFNGRDRNDTFLTAGVGASYTITEHFTLSVNYTYYQNWSNLPDFEFKRHSAGATLSTRW
jgi:hypothetical protein